MRTTDRFGLRMAQICKAFFSAASLEEKEAETLEEAENRLRCEVEPMRIIVSERTFVAREQFTRAVNLCRDMGVDLPAIWQNDTKEEEKEKLLLSDEQMDCRSSSLNNLIMMKTKRDCDVHLLSTDIRCEWSRLCSSSTEAMTQLYENEMYHECRTDDENDEEDEEENDDDKKQEENGRGRCSRASRASRGGVDSMHVKEMIITKERPLGCNDETMEMLQFLQKNVQHISSSVQRIHDHGKALLYDIQQATSEQNDDEKKEEKKEEEEEEKEKEEKEEKEVATLASVKGLLRQLTQSAYVDLPFHMKTCLSNIRMVLHELGPSANENEKNILTIVIPDNEIILSSNWKLSKIIGATYIVERIELLKRIKAMESILTTRLSTMSSIRCVFPKSFSFFCFCFFSSLTSLVSLLTLVSLSSHSSLFPLLFSPFFDFYINM